MSVASVILQFIVFSNYVSIFNYQKHKTTYIKDLYSLFDEREKNYRDQGDFIYLFN